MRYNHSVSLSVQAFTALAYRLAQDGQADLFLSGSGRSDETRCVIGFIPRSELIITDRTTRQDIKDYCFGTQEPTLGFISYTYGLKLRGVKTTKTTDFPLGHLKQYGAVLEHDLSTGRGEIHGPDENVARKLAALATAQLDMPPLFASPPATQVQQSLTQEAYESGVRKTLEAIRDGHTYQLNLSLKFSRTAKDMDMPGLVMDFWQRHPAPFYAFFISGTHTILSTSPERFLRVTDGEVLSQPIKGTLHFKQYTPKLEHKVTSSAKESAELSMIVDLVRNDISQNCEYGSVRVGGHKSTFIVDNLVQMYSNVHGRLREDSTVIDLLLDAFPGGSITGCPKRRSMELIETLEPHTRDVYCGSFVIIRSQQDMDSSIAIRTCWHDSRTDTFSFHAGSGIVVDSAPRKEYRETMAKAHKFLALGEIMIFYRNGEYHKDRIDLSVTSPALRYGFGFFETLYWDGGRVCRLEAHQKRIFSSLKAFDLDYVEEDFATIIPQVAHDNGLSGQTARINIQYPIDDTGPAQAIVMAAPYSPPDKPLRLVQTPRPFHSWLGLHKSTNHLPYFLEHKKALATGMNGAVLAAPSGHVLEVTHAALLFQDGNTLLTPAPPLQGEQAPGILPSTALAAASETLEITARPVRVDEIGNFKCAWALNSLMGMQPIAAIGQNTFTLDDETAKAITTVIHGS